MNERDIEELAAEFVRRFGGGAAMEAGHVAEKARRRGDMRAAFNWNKVAAMVRRMTHDLPARRDSDFLE